MKKKKEGKTPPPAQQKMQRSEHINIRATQKTVGQLAELQRILGERLGAPVSQGQAIAAAIDSLLERLAAHPEQGRLI